MPENDRIRLDKWLVFARVVKSRSLAQELVEGGHVRINKEKIRDGAKALRPGDVLTIVQGTRVRVLKLLDVGERRGPASEAQGLYEDLSAPTAERPTDDEMFEMAAQHNPSSGARRGQRRRD